MKNLGIKTGSRPSDYTAGALPYEVRNPSGNWKPYLPVGEIQSGLEDWMDCVSRSATNTIEIQEKFFTGKESNYNDREVALGSGTDRDGNWLWKVADYIRHTGLAQQDTYPDSGGTWDKQYSYPIPFEILQKLNKEKADWKTKWDVKDEDIGWGRESLKYHLKHAPIQVVVPGHAIVAVNSDEDVDEIFDSYPPYLKDVPGHYKNFTFAKKIVLYKKEQSVPDNWLLVDIRYLDSGRQVEKLIDALHLFGWAKNIDINAPYDKILAEAVLNFQRGNLSHTSWAYWWAILYYKGKFVGRDTRELINRYLFNRSK